MNIFNVREHTFGGKLRKGDVIGVLNIVEHFRITRKDPTIQFHIPTESHMCEPEFLDWLYENTNYLSRQAGVQELPYNHLNIWGYRIPPSGISVPNVVNAGEFLKIRNEEPMKNKICVFPIFDAVYHTFRMWSADLLNSVLLEFSGPDFSNYEKYICVKQFPVNMNLHGFTVSTDLVANIQHILTCSHYVGGETGLTLFASVLDNPKRKLKYLYSNRTHQNPPHYNTYPFYVKDGELVKY